MNAGVVIFGILAILAVGFYIFTITPTGKKWIKSL